MKLDEEILHRGLDMKCFCGFVFPLGYIVAGFLTFAWIHDGAEREYDMASGPGGLFGGMFWPIYWGGVGSIKAVQFAKSQSSPLLCANELGEKWPPVNGVCAVRTPQSAVPLWLCPNGRCTQNNAPQP